MTRRLDLWERNRPRNSRLKLIETILAFDNVLFLLDNPSRRAFDLESHMPGAIDIVWKDAYAEFMPLINAEGLLVWPFDPIFPLKVRFYTYDRRRDFRMCRHDYFELFYLHSGSIDFQLQDRFFPMREGDLVIINSTQYHTVNPSPRGRNDPPIHGVLLHFMPELILTDHPQAEGVQYLAPFLQQDSGFPHVIAARTGLPNQIFDLIQQMSAELPAGTSRTQLYVKTYLKMILVKLVNYYAAYQSSDRVFDHKRRSIERLRPLFKFLDEHYNQLITLQQAARIVNMSKSHFLQFFKQVTGLSFVAYLNQFRINRAQILLASTDKSIAQVGQEVGFSDQSHFGRVFRRLLNLTPREYRLHVEVSEERLFSSPTNENETERR